MFALEYFMCHAAVALPLPLPPADTPLSLALEQHFNLQLTRPQQQQEEEWEGGKWLKMLVTAGGFNHPRGVAARQDGQTDDSDNCSFGLIPLQTGRSVSYPCQQQQQQPQEEQLLESRKHAGKQAEPGQSSAR